MKTTLETFYWDLRKRAQARLAQWGVKVALSDGVLPAGADFSAEPLSVLDKEWFYEFARHPQINSLLSDALTYRFVYDKEKNEAGAYRYSALLDEACNYCLEILQKCYKTGDVETAAFRRFWELLMLPPEMEGVKKSQLALGLVSLRRWSADRSGEKIEKRLERETKEDFLPTDPAYEKIRRKYQHMIKTSYQKGFIYLLGEFNFNDFYIPPVLSKRQPGFETNSFLYPDFLQEREEWKNIFNENDILYIIGVPGSGKSLFLWNLMNNYGNMAFHDCAEYLIVCCDMKTYYTNGNSNKKSIPEFLQETIINTTGMEEADISIEFIRYYLDRGRCLVLMDALDEVPKANRVTLHKMIVSYFKEANPDNKVCITSRARGFLPQEEIEVLHISELTSQDISDYLDKMIALDKFKQKDKDSFLDQAQVLIDKHFLTNFLILSLMVNIYKAERKLPENKIKLYKKCFEYITKEREKEYGSKESYDWDLMSLIMKESTFIKLATLAAPNNRGVPRERIEEMLLNQYRLKYVDEATAENAIGQFLDFCSNRTDLFVLADRDETFKFFHRSFFEYFYSRYIAQQASVREIYRLMSQFDEDSEVFELTLALIKEENEQKYQELVSYIFTQIDKEFKQAQPRYTAFKILTMFMQVIDDAYFRREYVRLVIENPALMMSHSIQKMNQEQIAIGIQEGFSAFPEEADGFRKVYRDYYILFVMKQIGSAVREELAVLFDRGEEQEEESLRLIPKIPDWPTFYIFAYPGSDTLQDEVIHWGAPEFYTFLSALPGNLKTRRVESGIQRFTKYSVAERKRLWEWFSGQDLRNDKRWSLPPAEALLI